MNREIKFRAWDGKKMYLPEYSDKEDFHLLPDGTIVETHEHGVDRHELTSRRGDNWIVMQYTGLKDKNGKEIYDGDVVDLRPDQNDKIWHRVIEYDTAAFHSQAIHTNANHPLHFHKYSPNKDWVVIGNIFENPELIK